MIRIFLVTGALGHMAKLVSAVEMQPVITGQLLGGQYFYNDSDNALGGYAALSASPYMKFNDRWSLVPLYEGRYQGTKQVQDLIGGGTLFQDSQDHNVSVKGIRSFENGLKWKTIGSYGMEWLRETKDEGWTKGLYDSHRTSAGTELEWSWAQEQFVRLAYDFYVIHFPNYQSLESGQISNGLGRELAQPDVLDNRNHSLTLAGQFALPKSGLLEWTANQTFRGFHDQHIVVPSGDLIGDTRHDNVRTLSMTGTWPVASGQGWKLLGFGGYSWTQLLSDQNDYDAQKLIFHPAFYSYHAQTLSTRWTWLKGEQNPWSLAWFGTLGRQDYTDRVTQDVLGQDGFDRTRVYSASAGFTLGYPIAKGFQLTLTTALGWSDSNNTNLAVYQYHYHTANYLAGFTYAY